MKDVDRDRAGERRVERKLDDGSGDSQKGVIMTFGMTFSFFPSLCFALSPLFL